MLPYGGGPQKGPRDPSTHLKYLQKMSLNETLFEKARDKYTRSCAGYCIASYVIGIGDRNADNVLVRDSGEIFHTSFNYILGKMRRSVVGNYSWKREVAPFLFLPANKYCITNGDKDKDKYIEFERMALNAYQILRKRHKLLINLFVLMLPSQMPDLIKKRNIIYLCEKLYLTDIREEKIPRHISKVFKQCVNDKSKILDNIFHAVKHAYMK